jgi:hypothetical protein
MQAMSVIVEFKQRRCTRLTRWMGFHAGHVSDRSRAEEVHTTHELDGFHAGNVTDLNQAEEAHSDSRAGWDFKPAMSVIDINQRKCIQLTNWKGFNPGFISDPNEAEEAHTTHMLDGISCR